MGNGGKKLSSANKMAEKKCDKDTKAGNTTTKCAPSKRQKLIRIRFMDGEKEAGGAVRQYVNLQKDVKWVDGNRVKNLDRLSEKTRVRVTYQEDDAADFKLTVNSNAGNTAYSNAEKGRNSKFKHDPETGADAGKAGGRKNVDCDVSVAIAGGNRYTAKAKDKADGTEVSSSDLEVWRRIWIQQIKMKNTPAAAASLATLGGEYVKHKIDLIDLGSVEIERMVNIGSDADSTALMNRARTAYRGSGCKSREPYVVAVVYTDHLAVKDAGKIFSKSNVKAGPGAPVVQIPLSDGGRLKELWQEIVPGEGWFVSATYMYQEGLLPKFVNLPQDKCTAVPSANNAKACYRVNIDTTGLTPAQTQGNIVLSVNVVNRWRLGMSFGGGNLICVCTRCQWNPIPTLDQNQTMIHELGHKIWMVPDGTGDLDRLPKQYSGKGHVGPHCHAGVGIKADYGGEPGTCNMFGEGAVASFCGDCAKAVKKMDLTPGWSAF